MAIAAVVLTVVQLSGDGAEPTDDRSTTADNSGAVGDCSAVGQGNTITCVEEAPTPPSYADLQAGPSFPSDYVVFGDLDALPPPPEVPEEELFSRCEEWEGWLEDVAAVRASPDFDITVAAGAEDLVIISDIRPVIVRKQPAPEHSSVVRCTYGGGLSPGYEVHLDLASASSSLVDLERDSSAAMPPATLSLADAGAFGVSAKVASAEGYVYEGYFQVFCSVNGVDEIFTYGSPQEPIAWLGGVNLLPPELVYGWNHVTHAWARGLDPAFVE